MNDPADLLTRYRWWFAGCVIALTCLAGIGMTRLKVDSDPRAMLNARDLLTGALHQLEEEFGASDSDCVIVLQTKDFITPEGVAVVKDLVDRMEQLDGIQRVTSMLSVRGERRLGRYLMPLLPSDPAASQTWFAEARARSKGHPLLSQLLSEDRTTALVIVRLAGSGHNDETIRQFVDQLQRITDEVTADAEVTAALTGLPVLRVEMIGNLMRDQLKFNITAMCAAGTICWLMFRSTYATLMVMLSSLTGVIWTMGAMGWMGVPINMITSVIAPLVLVIGVSDAIHLHLEMRRARAAGNAKLQAIQAGLRQVGLACALTSLTTCIGFGSLRLASLDVIRVFGTWSAVGCVLNYVAVIVVLPLFSLAFPDSALSGDFRPLARVTAKMAPFLYGITHWRREVVYASVFVTAILLFSSLRLEAESKLTETISPQQSAYQALQQCDEQFGGALLANVLVEWSPAQAGQLIDVLCEVHEAIEQQPHIHQPTSLLNLLQSLPGASPDLSGRVRQLRYLPPAVVGQYVNQAKNCAVVDARIPDIGSRTLYPEFDALQREFTSISARYPGFSLELTGGSVLSFLNLRLVVQDLWRSLSAAAIVIILVLSVAFRSVSLGAISALPNVFPLVCAAAALSLLGRPLEVSSVVVFSMCLGIATDDTIHFLARYQRERHSGATPAEAVKGAIEVVGEAMLVTTVLLTVGFGSFMFSEVPALQNVGQLACIALITALIGDLVILPSLILVVYGRGEVIAAGETEYLQATTGKTTDGDIP